MKLVLDLLGPPRLMGAQQHCELRAGSLAVGRSPEADWVIPDTDRTISRIHLRIDASHGGFMLTDTSVNGVYVNGSDEAIGYGASAKLRDGDRLQVGDAQIAVAIEAAAAVPLIALDTDAFAAQLSPGAGRDPLGGPFGGLPARPAATVKPEVAALRPVIDSNWMNGAALGAPLPREQPVPERERPVVLPIRSAAPSAPMRAVTGSPPDPPSVLALVEGRPGLPASSLAAAVDAAGQVMDPAIWLAFHEKIKALV